MLLASCAHLETPAHRVIEPGAPGSALETARSLLEHLAAGNLEAAAALSNAPQQRLQILREYRASIGEQEFRRAFAQYLDPGNRLRAELALGRHRLLVWDRAGGRLAGQYYVEIDGRFLMDDQPSEQRSRLQRLLEAYREKRKSGSDPDF